MMRFNLACLFFLHLILFSKLSHAGYYNSVKIDGYVFHLEKESKGRISVSNTSTNENFSCPINGWNGHLSSGAGSISVTSDRKAMVIYPGNKYLLIDNVKNCTKEKLELHSVSFFDDDISTIIDINFDKKLVLALVVIDASRNSYQAILSHFNGGANILTGKGFWQGVDKPENGLDDSFQIGDAFYVGKISKNGKYVSPNDLDCSVDSFPGVWDIEKKKKVIFNNGEEIERNCQDIFSEGIVMKN